MITESQCRALARQYGLCNDEYANICLKTNTSWMKGRGDLYKQFDGDEEQLAMRVEAARRQGYVPNRNDVYVPQLAETIGDPAAWLPADDPIGAMQKVVRKKNMSCEGIVQAKRDRQPVRPKRIAESIVRNRMRQKIRETPELARDKRELRKLRDNIIQKHGKQG